MSDNIMNTITTMSKYSRYLLVGWILVWLYVPVLEVVSFPTGTGGCAGGRAAVGGTHKLRYKDPIMFSLQGAGITVSAGDTVFTNTTTPTLDIGVDYALTVSGGSFLGILIRLEAPDGVSTDGVLEIPNDRVLKMSRLCRSPIIGITHTSRTSKTNATATLRFDEAVQGVVLDITTVFSNKFRSSIYAYEQYTIDFA